MSGLPDRVVSGERIIVVAVALVLIVAIGGGVWAAGRGSSAGSEPAAAASSPGVQTSTPATLAAVTGAETPGEATTSPVVNPSPSSTKAAGNVSGASSEDTSSGAGSGAGSGSGSSSGGTSASKATTTSTPTPKASKTRTPTPTPTKTRQAAAVPTAAHFSVSGKVDETTYFTVAKLKKMTLVSESYFSRGKEPKEATNAFVGVRLIDILNAAGLSKDAERVTITAADDYSASFSLRQVKAAYIDETRSGVTLPMIIAFSEDGSAYTGDNPFRLVMGQTVAGDYNRQYWVRLVVSIAVL